MRFLNPQTNEVWDSESGTVAPMSGDWVRGYGRGRMTASNLVTNLVHYRLPRGTYLYPDAQR
jgi:hypothetical protein